MLYHLFQTEGIPAVIVSPTKAALESKLAVQF